MKNITLLIIVATLLFGAQAALADISVIIEINAENDNADLYDPQIGFEIDGERIWFQRGHFRSQADPYEVFKDFDEDEVDGSFIHPEGWRGNRISGLKARVVLPESYRGEIISLIANISAVWNYGPNEYRGAATPIDYTMLIVDPLDDGDRTITGTFESGTESVTHVRDFAIREMSSCEEGTSIN